MILADLGPYLAARRSASLHEMALHFSTEAEALRGMLAVLERKGRVRRVSQPCGGCCDCGDGLPEFYEWTGARDRHGAGR